VTLGLLAGIRIDRAYETGRTVRVISSGERQTMKQRSLLEIKDQLPPPESMTDSDVRILASTPRST